MFFLLLFIYFLLYNIVLVLPYFNTNPSRCVCVCVCVCVRVPRRRWAQDLPTLLLWQYISRNYYWYLKIIKYDNLIIPHMSNDVLKFNRFQFKAYWMVILLRWNCISYGNKKYLYLALHYKWYCLKHNFICFSQQFWKWASSPFIYDENRLRDLVSLR